MKRVLIIGSGGREHALAWKLQQSPQVGVVFVAPGNGGTEAIANNVAIRADDVEALADFARRNEIDLTVVGPELPLSHGVTDRFVAEGRLIFGPSANAARLETSKVFAKEFMTRHGIPTAPYRIARELGAAQRHVRELGVPVAVKADGLAAGKGVTVCHSYAQADEFLHKVLVERIFGSAGDTVVIEAGLSGQEISVLAFCDQKTTVPMIVAQDHKAAFDDDQGPNTGGMGCYAPTPFISADVLAQIRETVLQTTIDGMRQEGTPYRGVLYAGLMLTEDGPQLLEFNVRFGDPETQAILPLLETDLFEILQACATDSLDATTVRWEVGACVCVVCSAPGYPGAFPVGSPISGLSAAESLGATVFHAGTKRVGGQLVTAGGRVLGVTGRAGDLPSAIAVAYEAVGCVHFDGMHYRKDIGAKALRL